MQPFYEQVQAHYDLSNEFFALFLDPTRTYSCARFERDDMTLEEAQRAKIDLTLVECDLPPRGSTGERLRLLDIGCGWGGTLRRAAETHHVQGLGLTLSRNQHAYTSGILAGLPADVQLKGWEEFNEPVDRIISIEAFEHFRWQRYPAFFARCHELLPANGRLVLRTTVRDDIHVLRKLGIDVRHEDILFVRFIQEQIFPGSQLCPPETVIKKAKAAGFHLARTGSYRQDYAKTLDIWSANLEAAREEAIELTCPETYEIYQRYLTGCARYFRSGHIDVMQFTFHKNAPA